MKNHPHLTPALSATLLFPSNAGRSLRELGSRALRRWGAEREAKKEGGAVGATLVNETRLRSIRFSFDKEPEPADVL